MSNSNIDDKSMTINNTCTVSAWLETLNKLAVINPNAILTTMEHVLTTDNVQLQLWTQSSYGSFDQDRKRKVSDTEYFNVMLIDSSKDRKRVTIVNTLNRQKEENNEHTYKTVREFLDSLKEMNIDEQLMRVQRNTQFTETLYFFADVNKWYTLSEVTMMCGGKLYYNFDELFKSDKLASFIKICRIPYEIVYKTLLRDPILELLNTYELTNKI